MSKKPKTTSLDEGEWRYHFQHHEDLGEFGPESYSWIPWWERIRGACEALVIGGAVTCVALTFAYATSNAIQGCAPWAPSVVIWHQGVSLCPGQVVVGLPAPKQEDKKP